MRRQLLRRQFLRRQIAEDNRQFIANRKKTKHIRDNARHYAFIHDLLSHSMTEHGLPWFMEDLIETENYLNNRRFQLDIGFAVLKYQKLHASDMISEINRIIPRTAFNSMVDVLLLLAESTFKGENFVKEFFRFCAHIVTLGDDFMNQEQIWRLDAIVEEIYDVYIIFFKQRFAALAPVDSDEPIILEDSKVESCLKQGLPNKMKDTYDVCVSQNQEAEMVNDNEVLKCVLKSQDVMTGENEMVDLNKLKVSEEAAAETTEQETNMTESHLFSMVIQACEEKDEVKIEQASELIQCLLENLMMNCTQDTKGAPMIPMAVEESESKEVNMMAPMTMEENEMSNDSL